ncbi:restriction endonuclease subunit S, partial [bacterium]|nr:restriction endonuclease subunit S [bacterium]
MSDQLMLIDHLPKDWEAKKIKFVFDERKEFNNPVQTEILISLTHDRGVIPHSEKGDIGNKEKDDLTKYKIVHPGDIVVNSMNAIIGSSGLSNYYGLVSPVYYMLKKKNEDYNNKYFHYLFRSLVFQKSLVGVGNGILEHRMRVPMDKLGSHFIPLPPTQEQNLISRYLDKKTFQIDSLISKIEKKIELLKEQRIALINQYVTKGLDPNVEMKNSGVDWIGEIPKHWNMEVLKHISNVELSSVDRHEYEDEKRVNICHYPDVYRNEYIDSKSALPSGTCSDNEFEKFSLRRGDILLTKDSESPDDIGIPTFVIEDLDNTVCGYHLAIIRMKSSDFHSEFIYRYLESKSVKDYFYISSSGITRFGLGKGSIENLKVVAPPEDEQKQITHKVSMVSRTTKQLSERLLARIALLKEYRQSLISS